MGGIPDVGAVVGRVVATAQNGLEVLRLGGLETGTQPAPFAVVETEKMFKLRRYFPGDDADGPNVVLIPPMMVSANVYDVTEHNGAVSILHRHGIVPWVIDFGSPDTVEQSEFSATACKALRRCRACGEPFEHVKEI